MVQSAHPVLIAVLVLNGLFAKDPTPQALADEIERLLTGNFGGWDVDDFEHHHIRDPQLKGTTPNRARISRGIVLLLVLNCFLQGSMSDMAMLRQLSEHLSATRAYCALRANCYTPYSCNGGRGRAAICVRRAGSGGRAREREQGLIYYQGEAASTAGLQRMLQPRRQISYSLRQIYYFALSSSMSSNVTLERESVQTKRNLPDESTELPW